MKLQDYITCCQPANKLKLTETYHATDNYEGRWRKFGYKEIIVRDKTSLDITWRKDKLLADLDNPSGPGVLDER